MAASSEKRDRRREDVAARAAAPDTSTRTYCTVLGCGKPTRAAAGEGLNRRFCRSHEDHHQRHGSALRGSYGRQWLNPYRRAVFEWLSTNAEDPWVKQALAGVRRLYETAGPAVEAFRLRGLSAEARAKSLGAAAQG